MRFSKIKDNDIANGLGITMSFWTQGCPHHCKGCFNKETWDFDGGQEFKQENLDYIIENINKNNIYRDLAILGGEPLCSQNVEGVISLCREFKSHYPNKLIYLWTGYTVEKFNENQREILHYIDILIDGQFDEERKNLSIKLRGSSNQRVIDVKKYLDKNEIILYDLN
ncbi:MAG: anaerobic ribonucleoside-triphosphate reductase activating protein [Paraclostridium bifermentans]